MPREFPQSRDFESLRKEAKRWLAELRAGVAAARSRFDRLLPGRRDIPPLRDVQLALARERGFPGWAALKRALAPSELTTAQALKEYDAKVAALLEAYRTGTPEAMERHYRHTWHRRSWQTMRTYVQLDLGRRPKGPSDDVDITVDDARYLIAIEHGFESWEQLVSFVSTMPGSAPATSKPVEIRAAQGTGQRLVARTRDWNAAVRLLRRELQTSLNADGQMTDEMLTDLRDVEQISSLNLAGSQTISDDGIRHLVHLPNLRHLDLSGTAITDNALDVLSQLTQLQTISLAWTRVTDRGVVNLASCTNLREVNLSGTRTGDAAIRAVAGKPMLHVFRSGNLVTDEGLALLHDIPIFKTWHGGEVKMGLTSYDASPNYLFLRGSFTDAAMQNLAGLDGLFALNIDDRHLSITASGLRPVVSLPNLGWLAVDAKDDWMPFVADMPRLRFLGIQDTTAGGDGFAALSRSQSIEYIWGRRCHNLRRRGFVALADMPALRGLSVSCLNVDDAGVSALPRFPQLRELMPMDIPDSGYRHVAACDGLEELVLMYCRDTTDEATGHIVRLRKLRYYFNSYTTITDRTPALLSMMDTLERITFDACHGLTNSGIAKLARLPKLKELRVSGRQITAGIEALFPSSVLVNSDE
jgi:hypothetical protein